jgi:hypothetical protein
MKILGINFNTKKELKKELAEMKEAFPFMLGQVVYDIALKDDKGRYTKTEPSYEHSEIIEVVVEEKNYFTLVNRYKQGDVYADFDEADACLWYLCAEEVAGEL